MAIYTITGLVGGRGAFNTTGLNPTFELLGDIKGKGAVDVSGINIKTAIEGLVAGVGAVVARVPTSIEIIGDVIGNGSVTSKLNLEKIIIGDIKGKGAVAGKSPITYLIPSTEIIGRSSISARIDIAIPPFPFKSTDTTLNVRITNKRRIPFERPNGIVSFRIDTLINNRLSYLPNKTIEIWSNHTGKWEKIISTTTDSEGIAHATINAAQIPVVDCCQLIALMPINDYIYVSNSARFNFIDI